MLASRLAATGRGGGVGLIPTLVLALASLVGSGCSATHWSRFRAAEGAKSVSTIGDRKLPPTVGANGSQVVADTASPEPVRDPKARIAGRVVDADGHAVAGAVVRLADGGPKAGRDVEAVTDDSGGFTLGNLRPGAAYLLIAEADFGGTTGVETGRVRADTAETGVQIRLGSTEAAAPRRRTRSPRSRAISERVDGDLKPASPAGVNAEDLAAPAAAAGFEAAASGRSTRRARPAAPAAEDEASSSSNPGWSRPGLRAAPRGGAAPEAEPAATEPDDDPNAPLDLDGDQGPATGSNSTRRPTRAIGTDDEDDPLPPARPARARPVAPEPEPAVGGSTARAGRRPRARRLGPAAEPAEPGQLLVDAEPAAPAEAGLPAMPTAAALAATTAASPLASQFGRPGGPGGPPDDLPAADLATADPTSNPAHPAPGDAVFEPNPGGQSLPIADKVAAPADPSAGYNPFALVGADLPPPSTRVPATAARIASRPGESEPTTGALAAMPDLPARRSGVIPADSPRLAADAANSTAPDSSTASQSPKAQRWGDVVPRGRPVAGAVAAAASAVAGAGVGAGLAATGRPTTLLTRRTRAVAAKADAPAFCRFDPQTKQLLDFQLPDLDGQPVRLRDVEADLILFDFWGTWCQPCVRSVPHLIDLQSRYGPSRLKVVGVACEKSTPEKSRAVVAAAAEQLGINYPVVLSTMDGNCPVQQGFGVQNYPTMILVDRRGRILFTGVGNTESTMFRLDKAIAAGLKPIQTARR